MFKNILVPTDGSTVSHNAARRAVALAKATGAAVTGFHAAPTYDFQFYTDYVPPDFVLPAEYARQAKKVAERHLDRVGRLARAAGVKFIGRHVLSDFPAEAILKAAKAYRCDSIVMGSHGRKGVRRLFLGSQTQKVLAVAKVPVVVVH